MIEKKAIFLWFLFYTTRKLCVKLTFLSRWNSAVGGILQVLKFQCCHSHHLRHVSVPLGALPVPFLAFRTNVKISGGRPCSYCTYYCHCLYFGYLLIEVERFYCVQLQHNGLEDLEAGIFNWFIFCKIPNMSRLPARPVDGWHGKLPGGRRQQQPLGPATPGPA